jgi:hypothetical protein
MKQEVTVICGNEDCEAELRRATKEDLNGRLHQEYCRHCGFTSLPKLR